jgi:DNA-binding MltR family transcriptional regulator
VSLNSQLQQTKQELLLQLGHKQA